MAPSEETTSATCSQQQEQDVAGAKLQQDNPKIQEHAPTTREENINLNVSSSCVGNVDTDADSLKSVATNCADNIVSLAQRPNGDAIVCVENINPHVNGLKSLSNNCMGNTESVVDISKNVRTTCKEDINHILDNSESVGNAGQVVDSPNISVVIAENVGQGEDSPRSVINSSIKNNDQILDGPKKVATNCVENIDQVVTDSKSVTTTNLDNVNQVVECPASVNSVVIGMEEKVVDSPKCVASASADNTAEVGDSPKNEDVGASTITCVENIACEVSVSKERVANMSTDNASPVVPATRVGCIETGNKGCGDRLGEADEGESCDGDDDVREKCMFLLKELVSQADEVTQQRRGGAQQVEGGPLWCRLPFSKVSEALKSCRSSANSALADSKQSNTMQYTTYDSHRSTTDESDLIQDPANDCRVKETGASSSVLPMYPSPPDSFADESTPPPVFQGHKTMTVDPSLPSTPDDSSEDLLLGEAAITPFTPSSTKLLGSPSIASVTPSSDTVLGPFSMPLCPKTPCSSSPVEGNGCSPASSLVMVGKKPQRPSTSTALPAPQRFLFQVEPVHQMKLSDGQKLFACDICSGVYQRCFSLKRHYLRSHINHRYLTERDISNCGIIVSERLAKENPSGSSVEKKSVAVGMDINIIQGSLNNAVVENDITKTFSGNKCSIANPIAESCVIFPNLYRCHLCSICFDTKNELRGHMSTHKPAASKPISGNQQARSKSLPDLKKGGKERDRSLSASSQELSSLQVPIVSSQLMCESVAEPSSHTLRQIKFDHVSSSVAVPDQLSVCKAQIHSSKLGTSSLPKSGSGHSSSPVPTHSSKTATSSHTSKPDHSSKPSMPDHSLKPVTSNHSSKCNISSHSLKTASSGYLSKSSSFVHSSNPFSPGHSTKPFSSSHSLMLESPELISSATTKLTIPDQLLRPVISNQLPATLGQFTKPSTSDKLLKSTSSSERGQLLCLYCDKSFSTPTMHKRHVSRSHPHAQLSSEIKTPHHKCAYCTKSGGTFRELPLLVQHLLATHPDLYHVCTTCELRFDSKDALYHHQIAVHCSDYQWSSVQTSIPLPTLSHTVTSNVNTAGKLSQSAAELQDGNKVKTSSAGDVDSLVSCGEFLYTCSVCRQVFNDYVAMCRHHRQVHKGKRTANSVVGAVQSPTSRLDSRSQSPFVITEKGSKDQVQGNKDTESHTDEQEMKSDVLCKKPVNSNVCTESESDVQTNSVMLLSRRYDIETNDPASETVKDIHQTTDLNKNLEMIKQKDSVGNAVKGRSEEVVFAAGEGRASSPRSPHLPIQFTLFGNSAEQVDVAPSSANKCALIKTLDSLDNSDNVSCIGNKIGPPINSCDLTVQTAECGDDVSAGVNGDFLQTGSSDSQVFVNVDVKSTNDTVLSREKEDRDPKSSLKFLFEDISDHSDDSSDLVVAKTSVCVEPNLEIPLVGTSDNVKTITVAKSVNSKSVENSDLGSMCSVATAILDSVTDSSEPPADGTLCPFKVCSESSLAETSTSYRTSPASTLDISEPLEAKSDCLLPAISGSLKVHSDVIQVEKTDSVDEESEMLTDLISDCMEGKSLLTKTKNFAQENSKMRYLLADVSESVKEGSKSSFAKTSIAMEESCDTLLAQTVDSSGKIPESLCAGALGYVIENAKFSPDEISSDYIESSYKTPSDETSNSFEESSETVLTKESDSLEDSIKSSLGEMSDYVKPVIGDTKNTVESSLNVILNSVEPSLGKSSELSVAKTLESLKEAGTLPLPDCSNFTEATSKPLLVDNLDTVKGSSKLSSNSTEECSKFASADTLHSVEGISKLSLVDTPDSIEEENSKLLPTEIANMLDGSSNPSLIETSDSMELCCEQKFSETGDAEENSKLSLDDAAGAMEGRCKPLLVETSNSIDESAGSVDIISSKPLLAAESSEVSLTESVNSVEENLTIGLPETSDSLEQNFQSLDSSEDISESLLKESSVEQNCYPASAESLDSLEENSKSASTEISEIMEENSKLESAESLDAVEEKPKSMSTESSNSVEENIESLDFVEEESKSISTDSFDSVKEIHSPIVTESSYSLEEDTKFISTSLDSAKENHKLLSTESSVCLEKDYKPALTESSESMTDSSKSVLTENLELMAENPQLLLPEIVYSMDGCKPLSHESSDIVNINSDAVLETSDALKGKSKRTSSVTQDGSELISSRILRSNSLPLTKSVDSTEENETIPLHQRLLRSKNEVAINDQLAGSGRVLRKSFAVSVTKPVESVADSNDHHKGDSNRVLRSSGTPKNDEPSVGQEGTSDVDLGNSKSRPKASTASTRHTRLRKFSRRVRGEQTQEERHLDPETLFYCRIAGNIQENLLHHLDGKLEHEVTVTSRDWNRAGTSQPHTSVTTNQEEKHYHHHRAPWEKFNFPKNYDGRCGEGAVCLASYIKDMSHLDISTQLAMRQNLKRLTAAPTTSRSAVDVSAEISKDDVIGFSRGLCLSAKVCADRRRSLRSAANRGRDALAAAPGGAASTFTASASLKRWSSADDVAAAGSVVELSGEWVRPRSYICAACGVMFSDLWDLEDHKYSQHPNVWCTHYEFDQAALEQGADASKSQGGSMSPKDLCCRFLLVREAMETVPLPILSSEVKCTKCERGFGTLPELHRHILECGGDTTWMLLPSPNSSGRRARKWRPFGSRRRRQQSSHRRGMKRNIPTTPVKQYFRARHRTVAGDSDSIQRMLANLPAKRSTRRVIQFSEDEIKTRSQGTMHSNRLLRKRYKVSFASGVLRTSQKPGHKVVQSLQVRVTTADQSDSASKKLTVRTPKKLPAAPSVAPSVILEQTSVPKQQLTIKKQPRSKSQPVTSVPQSKSAGSDVQKKASRGGRSLSPAASKSEPVVLLNDSEDTKQPSVHKSRGRSRKKQSLPSNCDGLTELTKETSKKRDGSDIGVQEFDVDISTVGSTETSNILAAMRIAMLEGVITETPPSGAASTKKLTKKLSVKKHPFTEENETVLPGKRKKPVSSQQTSVKKKTKLSQSELEERFLRNKGYTHPDEITDEPIICKGCGLQFDNGSAELRHRKTCIYVPPEDDVGSCEVEYLHTCSHCCVQFPSVSTLLKHTQQCKAAVKSNTVVTGEPSTSPKKTAAKAKTRNLDNNHSSTATTGKEEGLGPKKSLGSIGSSSENPGKTKAKPGVTKTKKQITKRSASDSRIIKRKKFDLTDNIDDNLDATKKKKWLTGAKNISSCTTKRKVSSMEIVSTTPVEMRKKLETDSSNSTVRKNKKPDTVESAHRNPVGTKKLDRKENSNSSPVETNKKLDNTGNVSNSLVGTKKKLNSTESARKSTASTKKKNCSTEHVSNSSVESKGNVSGTENANSSPRRTKKKCNGTEIGSGNPARTKTKLDVSNRPVTKKKKLDATKSSSPVVTEKLGSTENANSSPLETGTKLDGLETASNSPAEILESVSDTCIGAKKKFGNTEEFGSGPAVSRKKQGNIRRSVSSSPVGAKKKLGRSRNYSPVGTNRRFESALNVSDGPVETEQQLPITQSDGISPVVGKEQLSQSESERAEKWVECGTETASNNPAKKKKRFGIAGSVSGSPIRTNSTLDNTEPANIILTGTKKKFGNIDVLKGAKRKSGSCESMSSSSNERKDKCSSTGNGICSPANSDMDDKMPELQKEEPIENLKTETPSPKVEDLCDIPILSPVGFEPLGEGHEEKKSSDADLGEIPRKNTAENKEEQSLQVQGKKWPKVMVKKSTRLTQVRKTIKVRKPAAFMKKKDAEFEISQIPLQMQPSKEETFMDAPLAVVEAGEVDSGGDVPLSECLGVSIATDEDEAGKVICEQDIKKAASLSKQQRRKCVQHRKSTLLWERQCKEEATKTSPQLTEEATKTSHQLTEEDSSDELLPISKLKEVIQKKTLPIEEIDSKISGADDADCFVEQMNSRVTEGFEHVSLVETNPPTGSHKVLESGNVAQCNTEESPEIPDHVTLATKSTATFRRAAVKKGKRDRTQSGLLDTRTVSGQHQPQAHQKFILPDGRPEMASVEGVHTGIQPQVEKIVISKRKARNYTEQVESQGSTQMEDSVSLSNDEGERNSSSVKGCEIQDKRKVVTKKKTKRQFDEMESKDGGSMGSSVSQTQDSDIIWEEKRNCLFRARQETNFSVVGEKNVAPLHLYEETGSATGRKLLVSKRKKFGSHLAAAACPLDQVNNATTCVGKGKRINHLVSEEHETKISDVGEEHKEMQRGRKSSVGGKKLGVTETKSKRQLDESSSQCKGNIGQTHSAKQEKGTDKLISERVAGSDGTNYVVGKRLMAAKRKSKQQLESRFENGESVDSAIGQRKNSRSVTGNEAETKNIDVDEQQDVLVSFCVEQETERRAKEPGVETVSSCEEIKVRRGKEVRNLAGKKRKESHLIDSTKETLQKGMKKGNSLNETEGTRQKIKLVIGKRRKRSLTVGEEQTCRLISEEEDKQTTHSEKEDASLTNVGKTEIGDQEEADEISAKDELHVLNVEEEVTGTSVADTDSRINLICEAENMNVSTCDADETTNTLVDETDNTKHQSPETEDAGSSVCWKEKTCNLTGGKKIVGTVFGEKKSSNLDKKHTTEPSFENGEGLITQVERMDIVDNLETENVGNKEEYAATLTGKQEEVNSEILGSGIVTGEKGAVPVRNEYTDTSVHHENYLNPVIIQQVDMNNQIVQVGSSSSAFSIVSGVKAEESQANVERPLRQARRTRCNTSYEELYTWSDVTSETEEDSSQDLPDTNVMAVLCQGTDVPSYEEIAAMIANGEHFFPSSSKKKKKKKLRNNSRQYRNGHLRRKRRKKQKLRTKLMKKAKRSAVNDFIVTDIETGQEESQDSCESIVLAEILKTEHQLVDTETNVKAIRRKKKKKRTKSLVKPESEDQATSNENAQICDGDKSKQKRKSSVGSIFFCTLCNKHYSTNYNLMKHKLSLMHKRLSERDQLSVPTDVKSTECEQWCSYALQNTVSTDTSPPVDQIVETELPDSETQYVETEPPDSETQYVETEPPDSETQYVETEPPDSETQYVETEPPDSETQYVETEQPSSDNQNAETESCNSVHYSVETEQEPNSLVHSVEMEQPYSSPHNTKFDKYCSSLVQSVGSEHPCSSVVRNTEAEHSCVVVNENTECEESCSVVQNVEGEESCATEPERTYTLMQNMDVEQFSSTCLQSASVQDPEADESGTSVEKPSTSQTNNEHILDPGNPIQNSALDGVQQRTDPVQVSSNAGTRNEVAATALSNIAAGVFCVQAAMWTEHQANVTSDWLGKERDLQQNTNTANWPASCEEQKQSGWFEGLVDNSQWMCAAGQWSQEMAWSREVNPDMNWNADSSQEDGTFFQSNSASLGSILDSVNQILDNERSADGLSTTDRYPPYVDLLQSGTADVDPNGGLRELQQAMGATDEEMAMLEQLGEGSWPLEDADIMDLDNQKSASATPTVAPTSTTSTPADTVSSRVAKLVEDTAGEGTRREEDGSAVSSIAMAQAAVTTRTFSGRGGLRTQDMQLARYESKDMVCPVCSRRFLGLSALRDHLAAAHNSSTRHRTQAVIKRPRIVPSSACEGSGELTRHVCRVCKELLPDEQGLADHVGVAHVERQNPAGKLLDQRPDGLSGNNHSTGSGGGGDEGLRSHMTSALGGLLTRALNNFLGKNRSQPSPPATQVPSPPAGSPVGSHSRPLLTQPIARLLGRGLKMANRRHSSGPADELPFNCVDCDERFSSESNRNRHIARAHRGQQYRRLSTDSPLELTRTSSPLTSSESTASEVDTDSLPLSIRISNFSSGQRLVDSEPCKSQLTAASIMDSETFTETKEDHSSWKGEERSAAIVYETDNTRGTVSNTGEEEELERATVAVKRSTDVGRRQEQEQLSESSRTDWRNGMKAKASQLRPESLCGVNDEDSIKAKAVAALRALNARDKRIRNGLPGTIGAAMWSGVSRRKSRGLNSDDRFRFPLVRKTPPSTNRFASLAEKKKKNVSSSMVKSEAISQPKGSTEEDRREMPSAPAIPISYDIYEFQDEAEQVRPPSEFGLAEFRLRAPLGKVGADTGPSSDVEEGKIAEWDNLLKDTTGKAVDPQPLSEQKGVFTPAVLLEALENTKQKVLKPLKLSEQNTKEKVFKPLRRSEQNPKPKSSHSGRKHQSSKKKRWHRIIVDSGEDTSDTDTVAEPHDIHRVALDQRLDNHREREKYINSEQRCEEGRSMKRRHMVPCLSGVLVEDRQCGKRAKTARKPSKGGSKRATKTDLLMSVFAKSRQRINSINSVATGRSVPAKSPFCNTLLGSYRSVGTLGNIAGAVNKSDDLECSMTSGGSAGNFATSSDDERMASGTKSQSKKQKRDQQKMTTL